MTATNQKPEPQPVSRFKKAVTGGAHYKHTAWELDFPTFGGRAAATA